MPLPKSHMAALGAIIKAHAHTLTRLRDLRDVVAKEIELREAGRWRDPNPKPAGIPGMIAWLEMIDREIVAHERQIEMARDTRLVDALAELLAHPDLAAKAARDPRKYAHKLGVSLPPDVDVSLTAAAGRLDLRITGYDPLAPFELHWTEDGFMRPTPESGPTVHPASKSSRSQPRTRPKAKRSLEK